MYFKVIYVDLYVKLHFVRFRLMSFWDYFDWLHSGTNRRIVVVTLKNFNMHLRPHCCFNLEQEINLHLEFIWIEL